MRVLVLLMVLAGCGIADDASDQVLALAAKGQSAKLKALLDKGAPLEATDRNGRTALMLAAQHGRLDTVKMLLDRGAKADARDKLGYAAWGLAEFEPAGHADHEAVLKL